ncbi:acyl-ACP desaturase [Streptomyces sp. McG5]|nr:acyl-ACP desaturase [Streptomyces sp. McG5]
MTVTTPHLATSGGWTDAQLLHALEEVVEKELNRHLKVAKDWMPHEYVPWSDGRNFPGFFEDGEVWEKEQSKVTPIGRTALIVNLLTEDNLPSYHHEIASLFGRDGAWGTWVHRWTAEEGRHGIVMRDYLLTSRAVDPDELERFRMVHMSEGFESDNRHSMLHSVAYVAFQELATRISHRNTGHQSGDPVCDRMLARIATDENLHMVFYRNLLGAAFELAPDLTMQAVRDVVVNFRMPGHGMPGFERAAAQMAIGEVYNLRIHHDDVIQPVLRFLKVMQIDGLGPEGVKAQEELGLYMGGLDAEAAKFDERLAARKARMQARATQGRGADLLEWTRTRAAELAEATPSPLRTELFQAPQDRVLCLTWWHPDHGPDLPELPEPPAELITRAVHRWHFESVEVL